MTAANADWLDHLHEAEQHAMATPRSPQDHFLRAQAHALISIAQSLRYPPHRYVITNFQGEEGSSKPL